MKQKIFPSIMAKSQKELNLDFKRLNGIVKELHLDIVDGKFAKNKTFQFPFRLSSNFNYNVHLMVKDQQKWVDKLINRKNVKLMLLHPEVLKDCDLVNLINKIKFAGKNVGLALKPETKINDIKDFLKLVDSVLILTVHPGFYGSRFLSSSLKKIKLVKLANPHLKVIIDGGINPKIIVKAKGADYFVSGSYVTKADHPKERIKILLSSLR